MKIVMVGAGNVATHIALRLAERGTAPVQIWSRHLESAEELAARVGCLATADMRCLDTTADIYVVSVADVAMMDVIEKLCHHCHDGVFIHTAGTMPMDMFKGHCAHYGVVYPMQTFTKKKDLDFDSVSCFVEASDAATFSTIETFARLLTSHVQQLSGNDRRWLHLAAVFACNFTNACYAQAARMLESHGVDFRVLLPLIDETTRKIHSLAPKEAQTGPAARHDYNVMEKHMEMLEDTPDLHSMYKLMSEIIMNDC